MTPEEARKNAAGRKLTEENPPERQTSKKSGENQITPQQGPVLEKRKYPYAAAGSVTARTYTATLRQHP